MHNFTALSLAGALLLAACAQADRTAGSSASSAQSLVSLSGDGELVEIERTPTYSLMQIRRAPAGSVPSAMYALRGMCAVLKARGATYASSERVAGVATTYRLTFPTAPSPESLSGRSKTVFSLSECARLRF